MDFKVRRIHRKLEILLVILAILHNIEVASCMRGNCTDQLSDEKNRDEERPIYPYKEDLRLLPSNIVAAHEILRKGLQLFLQLKELDLGFYLNYIIEKEDTKFIDEYGKEIRAYYRVFFFIWEQYNETLCENYAIKQFDKDKLDLCSVARYLSHQPNLEGRQTLMKRMGDALGYRCHPCTPYKRKEYGEVIVPNTDHISPEGVSPEESFIMCQGYSNHQGQSISSPIPSTTTEPTTTFTTTTTSVSTTTTPITITTGKCTSLLSDVPNRDEKRPIYPYKEDLRLLSSNIVAAHEILRKGLQLFLEMRELDLGFYLNLMIEKDTPFIDEYGVEIRAYYKVFSLIWQQYNETLCENYAIKQFDKDKLDLCSVSRYLSHQPNFKGRQTIMKRMGDALGYRCHPCTPYKRKEYGNTVVPNTDHISPEGVSPEDSYTMCKGYSDHQGQSISSPITSTTTTLRPVTTTTTTEPTTPFTTTTTPITTTTTTQPTTPFPTTTMKPTTTTLSTTMPTTPVTTTTRLTTTTTRPSTTTTKLTTTTTRPSTTTTRSTTSGSICKPEHHAICSNRKVCVTKDQICNGINDCGDDSDENGCAERITTPSSVSTTWSTTTTTTSAPSSGCQTGQFQCANKYCVDKTWRCDGYNNCGDNSDESNCPQSTTSSPVCQSNQFQCANKYCIDNTWHCDGFNNCGDNSDENGCQKPTTPPPVNQLPTPISSSPTPSVLAPATYGKTWLPYDCKITQNGNSYDKNCNFKEVDQSQVGYYRQQLGPEISPYSQFQSIPSGYNICNADSTIAKNTSTGERRATVTENYCFRTNFGSWISGSSSGQSRPVMPAGRRGGR